MKIKRIGSQALVVPPEKYFTGTVRLDFMFDAEDPATIVGANVTF